MRKRVFHSPSLNIFAAAVNLHLTTNHVSGPEQVLRRQERSGVAMAASNVSSRPTRPPAISCVDSRPLAESHWRPISLNRNPNYQGKQRESLAIPTNCLLHWVVVKPESSGSGGPRASWAAILGLRFALLLLPAAAPPRSSRLFILHSSSTHTHYSCLSAVMGVPFGRLEAPPLSCKVGGVKGWVGSP